MNMRTLLVILASVIILTVLFSACSRSTSEPSPTEVNLVGHVLDFGTGNGVPGLALEVGGQQLTTTATGEYTVRLPVGDYAVTIVGEPAPQAMMVRGPWTHGDLFIRGGDCGCRYGSVVDASTGKPIVGAALTVDTTVVTDGDGWYRIDGGCGSCGACNTAVMTAAATGYKTITQGLGRGFRDVRRLDIALEVTR